MRIGFDARMIGHPGIGRYIKNLLNAVLSQNKQHRMVLYGDPDELQGFSNTIIKKYTAKIYSLSELISSPFNNDTVDLMHIPHFNVPVFTKTKKIVVTIHDLIYLKFPQSRTRLKGIAAGYEISNAVKKADKIIAVSKNTKKDILEFFPETEENKISVIYEACDPLFKKIDNESAKAAVREKYNLPKPLILFVGTLKKHKNIERLIDAYNWLKDKKKIEHKLIIVGRYSKNESGIMEKIQSSKAMYLGEITNEELVLFYNIADLTVIPSLYEGFGLPVLEAMACGSPVVASDTASLSEIIKNNNALFNPLDVTDMAEKIYSVLANKELREALIKEGDHRVLDFSWKETAQETLKVYNELFAG